MLSLESPEVIEEVIKHHECNPEKHLAQKSLAKQVTELVHGPEPTAAAINLSESLFERKFDPSIISEGLLSDARLRTLDRNILSGNPTLLSLLRTLFPEHSNSKLSLTRLYLIFLARLRHFISSGAFQLNYEKITDPNTRATSLFPAEYALINFGKSSFYVIKITNDGCSILK